MEYPTTLRLGGFNGYHLKATIFFVLPALEPPFWTMRCTLQNVGIVYRRTTWYDCMEE